jgi:hypothetical protein
MSRKDFEKPFSPSWGAAVAAEEEQEGVEQLHAQCKAVAMGLLTV